MWGKAEGHRLSKVDVRSGTAGQIVCKMMNPRQERAGSQPRGSPLWNNLVTRRPAFGPRRRDRPETWPRSCGRRICSNRGLETHRPRPRALRTSCIVGGSGGERSRHSGHAVVSLDDATARSGNGKNALVPGPARPVVRPGRRPAARVGRRAGGSFSSLDPTIPPPISLLGLRQTGARITTQHIARATISIRRAPRVRCRPRQRSCGITLAAGAIEFSGPGLAPPQPGTLYPGALSIYSINLHRRWSASGDSHPRPRARVELSWTVFGEPTKDLTSRRSYLLFTASGRRGHAAGCGALTITIIDGRGNRCCGPLFERRPRYPIRR